MVGKIAIGAVVLVVVGGVAYFVVKRMKHAPAKDGTPASTTVAGMEAMTLQTKPPPKSEAPKMAGRKRHSRFGFGKLRSLAKTGIRVGAIAGVPGAGNVQALGVV